MVTNTSCAHFGVVRIAASTTAATLKILVARHYSASSFSASQGLPVLIGMQVRAIEVSGESSESLRSIPKEHGIDDVYPASMIARSHK